MQRTPTTNTLTLPTQYNYFTNQNKHNQKEAPKILTKLRTAIHEPHQDYTKQPQITIYKHIQMQITTIANYNNCTTTTTSDKIKRSTTHGKSTTTTKIKTNTIETHIDIRISTIQS